MLACVIETAPPTDAAVAPRTRAPRRDAAENRQALIEAARRLLNQDRDATLEAIAAEAGLSRRAVYGHFATRDELIGELISGGVARVGDLLAAVEHPDPARRLALVAATLWAETDAVRMLSAFAVADRWQALTDPALAPLRGRLVETAREGARNGALRHDLPPETVARLVEDAATSVLEQAARSGITGDAGRRLVQLAVLGAAGLDWRTAGALLEGMSR